jgi:hypothetical protein
MNSKSTGNELWIKWKWIKIQLQVNYKWTEIKLNVRYMDEHSNEWNQWHWHPW